MDSAGGSNEAIRLTSDPADESEPSFSPDGTRIAFSSERDGGGIYVVPALGGDMRKLADRGSAPRFSPDGQWIAYCEIGYQNLRFPHTASAYIIPSAGGAPRPIQPGLLPRVIQSGLPMELILPSWAWRMLRIRSPWICG